jgi:transcriptional regulator with GAF, ATPase, and Fis domain
MSEAESGPQKSRRFPDYVAPTKIHYVGERLKEIHLRKCKLSSSLGGRTREHAFDQAEIRIGAMDDNDLVVNDETVSRYHCKIIQEDSSYVLVDLGSTNGTFINRVRVREGFLKPGCTVGIGNAELKFQSTDEKVEVVPSRREHLGSAIGRHVKMRELFAVVEKIAPTGTTVVLEGETGTGKEVIAQAIHKLSQRAEGPIMVFDCGAVPKNLIESELFGHEKGSFTGAVQTRQGLFETAHGGTLFLDELGELPLDLQPKLLRALEQREIRRVGSNRPIKIDVRIIAATNRNLEAEVRAQRFRQDLYYRLSVVRLHLPPLRDRVEDIPLLAKHFLQTLPANRRADGEPRVSDVSRDAMDLLAGYQWPGNVRELVNVIERAVSFAEGEILEVRDLPESLRGGGDAPTGQRRLPGAPTNTPGPDDIDGTFKDAKERWVSSFERDYIVALLKKNRWNISHAAREADIDRKYFRKLMRKYAIEGAGEETNEADDE